MTARSSDRPYGCAAADLLLRDLEGSGNALHMTTLIMPVGASNTWGLYDDKNSPGGYRGPLHYMLPGQGADVDFVGLDRDGAIADSEHNGYSGKKIEWFTNPVNEAIHDPKTGAFSHHAGADTFVFNRGEAHGDRVADWGAGDKLHFAGFGSGAVAVYRGNGAWSISHTDGVEVIEVRSADAAVTHLVEGADYFFLWSFACRGRAPPASGPVPAAMLGQPRGALGGRAANGRTG